MSYSRWLNSIWYTYWDVHSGETRDSQVFTVSMVSQFTYGELKGKMVWCLETCSTKEEATAEQTEELRGYMNEFMKDVEEEFPCT